MKKSILVAGVAAIGLAGTAAFAAGNNIHEMTVRLPGGGVEHIQYTGDLAPKVTIAPFASIDAFAPNFAFGFPNLSQIRADMDRQMRQMDDMIRQANTAGTTEAQNGGLSSIAAGPPGSQSYSMVSTFNGNNFCSRSVEVTRPANGAKPKVVSHTSGNCGAHATADRPAAAHRNAV